MYKKSLKRIPKEELTDEHLKTSLSWLAIGEKQSKNHNEIPFYTHQGDYNKDR